MAFCDECRVSRDLSGAMRGAACGVALIIPPRDAWHTDKSADK